MFTSKPFFMKVEGEYALFTDPMSKGSGEKFTYPVPTMQALQGIVEANYWKPTLRFLVDEVKVLKPIRTETKNILLLMTDGEKDLSHFTYLRDVSYAIKFHFEWAEHRPDLVHDRNEAKHEQIILRSMQRGGRHDVFLGTRECIGSISRLRANEYDALETPFSGAVSFGVMFHSFSYAEQEAGTLYSQFDSIVMKNGVITFRRPEECMIRHKLNTYKIKKFHEGDYIPVDTELDLYEKDGDVEV